MREIKFRAWDKIQNVMRDNDWVTGHEFAFEKVIYSYGYEVMQYTGLKDKNGTPIYEGDVFGVYSLIGEFAGKHEPTGSVIFDTDLGAYTIENTNGGWEYLSEYLKTPRIEIIGNIYENPNLVDEGIKEIRSKNI